MAAAAAVRAAAAARSTAAAAAARGIRGISSIFSGFNPPPPPNPPPKADPTTNLFVSGLSKRTTTDGLKEAFSKFGELLHARVVTDRVSGYSKGFGFVRYSNLEEAEAAIKGMDGKFLDGWVIFVEYARPRPPQSSNPQPPMANSNPISEIQPTPYTNFTGFRSENPSPQEQSSSFSSFPPQSPSAASPGSSSFENPNSPSAPYNSFHPENPNAQTLHQSSGFTGEAPIANQSSSFSVVGSGNPNTTGLSSNPPSNFSSFRSENPNYPSATYSNVHPGNPNSHTASYQSSANPSSIFSGFGSGNPNSTSPRDFSSENPKYHNSSFQSGDFPGPAPNANPSSAFNSFAPGNPNSSFSSSPPAPYGNSNGPTSYSFNTANPYPSHGSVQSTTFTPQNPDSPSYQSYGYNNTGYGVNPNSMNNGFENPNPHQSLAQPSQNPNPPPSQSHDSFSGFSQNPRNPNQFNNSTSMFGNQMNSSPSYRSNNGGYQDEQPQFSSAEGNRNQEMSQPEAAYHYGG